MGEYARINGQSVKIGTCEDMYYLRAEDAHKAQKEPHSLDAATCLGLRFRLPFPDEDGVQIGHYDDPFRGFRLYRMVKDKASRVDYCEDFAPHDLSDAKPGNLQLRHEASGLLLNVPCHHGVKLPEITGATAFWNGKGYSLELIQIKRVAPGQYVPIVQCRHCGNKWAFAWAEVLPFVADPVLHERLAKYA